MNSIDSTTHVADSADRGAMRRAARLATPHMQREQRTMRAMLRIFCRDLHGQVERSEGLCAECAALAAYARQRLAGCPYGADKPTCGNCKIHCYGPQQREQVRVMMRHAGPKMVLQHPWLSFMHLIDGRRPAPEKPRNRAL